MDELRKAELECYLKSTLGPSARILDLKVLGESDGEEIKSYGYGKPLLIDYESDGSRKRAVMHTVKPGPFGHEHKQAHTLRLSHFKSRAIVFFVHQVAVYFG